jgi:hypothetical protein
MWSPTQIESKPAVSMRGAVSSTASRLWATMTIPH